LQHSHNTDIFHTIFVQSFDEIQKIYVRDRGITQTLLNIQDYNSLLGHAAVGGSWKGFVIENIMSVAPSRVQPCKYGNARGAEIDLVLEFPGGAKWAIGIKRNSAASFSKGFIADSRT